jgi:excisionase family DNA binding protein
VVPRAVVVLVAQISLQLAAGVGVSIVPSHAELTTQEAADLLNVSRPYLIGLLEEDKITYRTVGRHRRIRFEDLMRYKRQNDVDTRAAADELTALSQELGLY